MSRGAPFPLPFPGVTLSDKPPPKGKDSQLPLMPSPCKVGVFWESQQLNWGGGDLSFFCKLALRFPPPLAHPAALGVAPLEEKAVC